MKFRKKTIRDIDVVGKNVLVRVDYNVPMKDGEVVEDMRISASLPTLNYLLAQGCRKLILISHLGRPKGGVVNEYSLAPVAQRLAKLLANKDVRFCSETTGEVVREAVADTPNGGVLMLENLRFSPEEEANSEQYADEIIAATGAEVFVQDGFAVIHRAHASTDAIARKLPAVAGFLVEDEVSKLEEATNDPEHPVLVMIGGAKVEDKQPLIEKFLPIADMIAVGGKIAADGYANENPKVYVAEDFSLDENGTKLDIGPRSIARMDDMIRKAKTIIWNGVMGLVEDSRFAYGSQMVATAMGHSTGLTIVGGGDTAGFVEGLLRDPNHSSLKFSLVSTGGGASLELLCGKKLPGLEVLLDA